MERKNNNRSELEEYGFVDKTHRNRRSMKKDINRLQNRSVEEAEGTMQLPADIEASLFSGLVEPFRLVRKFKKTEPESYLAVDALLKDNEFLKSEMVLVRENGFAFIPVLLALGKPNGRFLVSSWMVDKRKIMERNATINMVEARVDFVTEGLRLSTNQNYNAAVLVHEQHQNPEILMYEAAKLLSIDTCSALYLVTHKKKGGVSVTEKISSEIGADVFWTKKGLGGVIIVRFTKKHPMDIPEIPISDFDYEPRAGTRIRFKTVPSLFSTEEVDIGTDFLIREVLSEPDPQQRVSVYDLACGYGVIGLSLAACLDQATVVMSDADVRAVDMAKLNVRINNLTDRVSVQLADGVKGIKGSFDLVVSNPPLHTERSKLVEILTRANKLVKKGGRMLLVVEDSRAAELREILEPYVGFIRKKAEIPSHSVLEIKK